MMSTNTGTKSTNTSAYEAHPKSHLTVVDTEKSVPSDREQKNGSTLKEGINRKTDDHDAAAGADSGFYAYRIPRNDHPLQGSPKSTILSSSSVEGGSLLFPHKDETGDTNHGEACGTRKPVELPPVERQWLHLPGPSVSLTPSFYPSGDPLGASPPLSPTSSNQPSPSSAATPSYQWCRRDQFWRQYDTAKRCGLAVMTPSSSPPCTTTTVLPQLLLSMEPRPQLAMSGLSALQGPLASRSGGSDPLHETNAISSSSSPPTHSAPVAPHTPSFSSLLHAFFTVTPEEYAAVMPSSSPTEPLQDPSRSTPIRTTEGRDPKNGEANAPPPKASSSLLFSFDYRSSCKLLTLLERFGNAILVQDRWASTDATGMAPRVSSTPLLSPAPEDRMEMGRTTMAGEKRPFYPHADACGWATERREEEEAEASPTAMGGRLPLSSPEPIPTVEDVFLHYQQLTSRVMAYRLGLLQEVLQQADPLSSSSSSSSSSPLRHPLLSAMQKHPFLSHPLLQARPPPPSSRAPSAAEGGDHDEDGTLAFSLNSSPAALPSRAALRRFFMHHPRTAVRSPTKGVVEGGHEGRGGRPHARPATAKRDASPLPTVKEEGKEEAPTGHHILPSAEAEGSHAGLPPPLSGLPRHPAEDWSGVLRKRRQLRFLLSLESEVQVVRTRARGVYAALLPRATEVLQRASAIWSGARTSVSWGDACVPDASGSSEGSRTPGVAPPTTTVPSVLSCPMTHSSCSLFRNDGEATFQDILHRTLTSLRASLGPLASLSSLPSVSPLPLPSSNAALASPSRSSSSSSGRFPPPELFALDPHLPLHITPPPPYSSDGGSTRKRAREEGEEEEEEEKEPVATDDDEDPSETGSPLPSSSSTSPGRTDSGTARGHGRGRRRKRGRGRYASRHGASWTGVGGGGGAPHPDLDLSSSFTPFSVSSATTPLGAVCDEVGDRLHEVLFCLERIAMAGWVLPPLPPLEFPPPLLVVEEKEKEEEEEGKRPVGTGAEDLLSPLEGVQGHPAGWHATVPTVAPIHTTDEAEGGASSSLAGHDRLSDRVRAETKIHCDADPPPERSPPRRARGRGASRGRGRGRGRGGGQEEAASGGRGRPTVQGLHAMAATTPPPYPSHGRPTSPSWVNDAVPPPARPRAAGGPPHKEEDHGGVDEGGEGNVERMRTGGGGETTVEDGTENWPPEPYLRHLKDLHASGGSNRAHSHLGEAVLLSLPRTAGIPVAFREVEEELEKHLWEHPDALMEGDHPMVAALVSQIRLLLLQNKAWRKHAQKWDSRVLDGLLKIKEESETQQRFLEAYYCRRGQKKEE